MYFLRGTLPWQGVEAGTEITQSSMRKRAKTSATANSSPLTLNTATLRLKRGHRYGLCGENGKGKSTLMRAINKGQGSHILR